ncbi:mitochondrial intermediate peptidase [Perkinsela sp. CCAP 1560/4]|nr:mitochondrial intermediate peptidase [Perkinsela sp. CCAP 1560/4]|eukprot:KNH08733.1 mitochondrial intermediate peptidase [Perkinsela sp. CCAP 1560/4]
MLRAISRRLCVGFDERHTRLAFLESPEALKEGSRKAISVCQALHNLLGGPISLQHRHDVLDSMSNTLCRVLDPCEFVRHMHPDVVYTHAAQEAFTEAHTYMCELNTSSFLYEQLKILADPKNRTELDAETNKNVAQLKRDMESNGIHLPDEKRKLVMDLNVEKENISAQFLQKAGKQNPYGTLRSLLRSRNKLSKLLEYDSFAQQQLRGTILDSQEKVWHFLCAVSKKYSPMAVEEIQYLRKFQGLVKSAEDFTDEVRARLTHSQRQEMESLNLEEYFSVANCWKGVEILCHRVFGLQLKAVKMEPYEQFHEDVRKYAVLHEADGFLGTIVVDLFARNSKACQAGHMTIQLGCRPHVEVMKKVGVDVPVRQFPIVVLTCNAGSSGPRPLSSIGTSCWDTTLMHMNEVTTLFHEFGHAIHSIFGQTSVQNLAGTRSSIDFVETFSQLFEHFLSSPEFVQLFAKNSSNNTIPKEKVIKYAEMRSKLRALEIMDQVVMSGIDQALHGPEPIRTYFPKPDSVKGEIVKSVLGNYDDFGNGMLGLGELMVKIAKPLSPITPTVRGVLKSLSFEHMSSYPANYYGYLYSAVFAKRIWDKFFVGDPLNRKEGDRLRQEVMCFGGACDPKATLQAYLGEDLDDLEVWI